MSALKLSSSMEVHPLRIITTKMMRPDNALIFIFAGFLLFYLLESVMVIHSGAEIHYTRNNNPHHSRGKVMFTGLFLHSLIDGVIIGIGFEIKPELGLLASIGVILHELPEGVTTFSILLNTLKKKTALYMSIAVALATPIGAVASLAFFNGLPESYIGLLLALAGGSFLYIAASDLIPETHEEKIYLNTIFLFLGVLFLYSISILISH